MKTIEEILNSTPVFLEAFSDEKSVYSNFTSKNSYMDDWTPEKELTDYKVLFAWYDTGNYEGDAFVIASKDDVLYEVNGGHCSCYGLEGQWDPEVVVLKELTQRLENKDRYERGYEGQLRTFLGITE